MKMLIINPNTSEIVRTKIAAVAEKTVSPGTEISVINIPHGPVSLESFYDEALATPYTIECVKQANADGVDVIVLAAFCDPGIEALKEISAVPVYGLEECSFSVALLLGNRFGILTEQKHKEAVKAREVRKHGLESRFAGVKALHMGVVEIASDPASVKEKGMIAAQKLIECGAEVIIMGCASMAGYSEDFERELKVPIIDPISTTIRVAEALTAIHLRHSKIGLYSVPKPQKMN